MSLDTKDHSLAATKRKVLGKYFDEKILEKDYHGTPIRKKWDTYMQYNADQIPAEARAFHAIQSSHRPDTAEKNYIMPKHLGLISTMTPWREILRRQFHQRHQSKVVQQTVFQHQQLI